MGEGSPIFLEKMPFGRDQILAEMCSHLLGWELYFVKGLTLRVKWLGLIQGQLYFPNIFRRYCLATLCIGISSSIAYEILNFSFQSLPCAGNFNYEHISWGVVFQNCKDFWKNYENDNHIWKNFKNKVLPKRRARPLGSKAGFNPGKDYSNLGQSFVQWGSSFYMNDNICL